jgi:hypothetical protein
VTVFNLVVGRVGRGGSCVRGTKLLDGVDLEEKAVHRVPFHPNHPAREVFPLVKLDIRLLDLETNHHLSLLERRQYL